MKSRHGVLRSKRFIKKRMKEQSPPNGKFGGEDGNVRGDFMEQRVAAALTWLKSKEQILDFNQQDTERKDFSVLVINKRSHRISTIEVKSSEYGRLEYIRKTEELRKKGKVICADLILDVNEKDTIFTIAERIAIGLKLS